MDSLAILQARTSSSRLPEKVLKQVNGRPMIEWQIRRIFESSVNRLVLATSNSASDDELAMIVQALGVEVFRGDLHDVHSRFTKILEKYKPEAFLRLTGDCPLVMPELINQMLRYYEENECDYLSNTLHPTFPDGLDIEVIRTSAFLNVEATKLDSEEREHVTLRIYRNPLRFRLKNYKNEMDLSQLRWTVDYPEDLEFIRSIFLKFQDKETEFTMDDILELLNAGKINANPLGGEYRNIKLK